MIVFMFFLLIGYCLEKWELLDTVYLGVNFETRALLEQWDFYAKTADEACDFLDWLAWDTHEFETSCLDSYIPPPASLFVPLLCVIFAIVLIMTVLLVPIIFLLIALLNLVL